MSEHKNKMTPRGQQFVSEKIRKLMAEGMEQQQAIAAAMNMAREKNMKGAMKKRP